MYKTFTHWACVAVFIVCSTQMMFADSPNQKIALVIGNAHYKHLPILKNPSRDALSVARLLSTKGFTTFLIQNATAEEMQKMIGFVANHSKEAAQILIYYAGHNAIKKNTAALLPVDYNPETTPAALTLDTLLAQFNIPFAQKAIIVDACLETENPLAQDAPLSVALPLETLLIFATSYGQAAYDGQGQHSIFTGAFLDHVSNQNSDIETALHSLRKSVIQISQAHQIPVSLSTLTRPYSLENIHIRSTNNALRNTVLQSYSNSGYAQKPLLETISSGLGPVEID